MAIAPHKMAKPMKAPPLTGRTGGGKDHEHHHNPDQDNVEHNGIDAKGSGHTARSRSTGFWHGMHGIPESS